MFALLILAGVLTHAASGAVESSFDPATGIYQVTDKATGWSFLGQVIGPVSNVSSGEGHDALGAFDEISFTEDGPASPAVASIRSYHDVRAAKFRLEYRKARTGNGVAFPQFSAFPAHLHEFSYRDATFAPPTFGLAQTATPWLLFDDGGRSAIVSPASEFMVSRMVGDGKTLIGEGFDPRLRTVRAGTAQESILVFGDRIGGAWNTWGDLMRRLYDRPVPMAEADPLLRDFGYWTDNGADYYYNYDLDKGYAGTLLALRNRYRAEGIPLGYLQLDSWWYSKSVDDPSGKPGVATKNSKLPDGLWNRYGGLLEYRANRDLFPDGLPAFERRLSLPLAVHDRWMDRQSDYHRDYRISGIAVTDPRWWNSTASYLASCGVRCYEQDWLDPIYAESPDLAGVLGVGDAFTDGMAHAMERERMSMQYCMATPRFFLQGVKYPNLTTIRTSGDRFEPRKWSSFLYGSQFAEAMGIWPWSDVFKSAETGNMILAVLSGGPVGTGDAMGKESKDAILKAARPDGVLVKPDAPLVPSDQTYLAGAAHQDAPFWASTFTDHEGLRTTYLFAFKRSDAADDAPWPLRLSDVGIRGDAYLVDCLTGAGRRVRADETISVSPGCHQDGFDFAYLVIAPYTRSGAALIGDLGKWVPTGKQRIEEVANRPDGMHVRVLFARQEQPVTIEGASSIRPTVRALVPGRAVLKSYDPETQRWTIDVIGAANLRYVEVIVKAH